jgi:uncharacterized protein
MIKKQYDVIIVGAGPAGLFAAYELSKQKRRSILIIDKGKSIDQRERRETMCGVGGAGTFSDGKLIFSMNLSHEKLLDIFSPQEYQEKMDYIEHLFQTFGVTAEATPKSMETVRGLVKESQQNDIHLYIRKCRHVGSDRLPSVIKNIEKHLIDHGVSFLCETEVDSIEKNKRRVIAVRCGKRSYSAQVFLVAPGRYGAQWLQRQAATLGLSYDFQKVEIGVRVEFPAYLMEDHSKIMYETIYSMRTPTYDDVIRTFCPCPNGTVAIENYGGFVCVNGHTDAESNSLNSNFDFATEVHLNDPVENTTDYAVSVAKLTTLLGGGKPIIQRLADLQRGRRSTWERIKRSYVVPSLIDSTPGDIALAYPHRILTDILEGLEMLDKVVPGISSGATLLYAPEIKLRGNRIRINKNMQTQIPNLYVAGDGAGASGNIVGAAISGVFAAKGIHEFLK